MRQAKYRKVLWVILLAELALLHVGVLLRLYVLRWDCLLYTSRCV